MSEERAIRLMDMMQGTAALLVLDEDGELYRHQTGGVCCNHPTACGRLEPLPERVRNEVIRRFFGRCPTDFEVRELMRDFCMPWEPSSYPEEAWVPLKSTLDDSEAVLVWNNSD
jgi:hypothetical protein